MGNRQSGKMSASRQELTFQHRSRKRETGKTEESNVDDEEEDPLSPELHRAVFQAMHVQSAASAAAVLGSSPGSAVYPKPGSVGSRRRRNNNPNFVSEILREELRVTSCQPDAPLSPHAVSGRFMADGGGDVSEAICSHVTLHSPSARRKDVLQPSDWQNHQNMLKGERAVPQTFADDIPSSGSFPKRCCLEADPLSITVKDGGGGGGGGGSGGGGGANSSLPVPITVMAGSCMDRLEKLKKNIEQCNTENFTHSFNNTGFAQLQSEADYDNTDHAETHTHRRNKSMSPNNKMTVWMMGGVQSDGQSESKAVRKLSEPSRSVYRTDSISAKNVMAGCGWSKSAENSPVIVRRALPSPGSPIIVQRTPSQSPSVERRFPANAPVAVSSGRCVDVFDSPKPRPQVFLKALSKHQDCLEARESSHSIRQKVTAEICLPRFSTSPVSVRKMPESPILYSPAVQHHGKYKDGGESSWRNTGDRYVAPFMSTDTSRRHCLKAFTSSSCSSSESESTERKLRPREEKVSPLISPCNSSTSSPFFPAASCTGTSPTPIQFCSQPKGTPVRTCTVGSQPSTAVVLASRESRGSLRAMDVGGAESTESQGENAGAPAMPDCKDDQSVDEASAHRRQQSTTDSGVTEDTIKQNSQSAVFGSVSPKLLRHRRLLLKESADDLCDSQHTFPKQSQSVMKIPAAQIFLRHGEHPSCSGNSDGCMLLPTDQLSHSAPSSFSFHGLKGGDSCGGANKTLGQRIREVISEATVGPSVNARETSCVFVKQAKAFSKDDIFASSRQALAHEKSSCSYSFSSHSTNRSEKFAGNQTPPFQNVNGTALAEAKCQARAAEELKTKPPCSQAGTKSPAEDNTQLPKNTVGHFYQLGSSRDSCSSCVSNSSPHLDSSSVHGGVVAELTRANLSQQSELLSGALHSSRQALAAGQLGVPVQRLVSSDTSDTLSTDRDTSGSSKRESSTSTATDDTLTSFKTRSTANSADYEEAGFVLPQSLVFFRSADRREVESDEVCAFESEQTTIKRKLAQAGQSHEPRGAENEPVCHKTRKKRRKQLQVQSQIITASREHSDGTLTRNRAARDVYSDEVSDDTDLFSSKDGISDLPSSRDDMSDLPSSRDDISDLPSSRDDISDLHSSRDDISDFPPCSKSSGTGASSTQRVFHRSCLQSAVSPAQSPLNKGRSLATKPTTDYRCALVEQSGSNNTNNNDTNTHRAFLSRPRSSSPESCETFLDVSETPGQVTVTGDSEKFLSDPHGPSVSPAASRAATARSDIHLSVRSPPLRPRKRLAGTPARVTSETESAEDVDHRGQIVDTNLYPFHTDDDGDDDDDDDDDDEGKELSPVPGPDSPDSRSRVVLSCTIYNSACH